MSESSASTTFSAAVRQRAAALQAIRGWFYAHQYLEVSTPCLVRAGGMEAHLVPFSVNGLQCRTSPEFALKQVLSSGVGRIFEIAACFRDDEVGPDHRAEFLMLEWYRAGASLFTLMADTEELLSDVSEQLTGDPIVFRRVSLAELFEPLGIHLSSATTADFGTNDSDWDEAMMRRFVTDIEPTLTTPTIVYHYPPSQAALAQIIQTTAGPVAARFEVYLGGRELGNAFQELGDLAELERRQNVENQIRSANGHPQWPKDPQFSRSTATLPHSSGIAVGVERFMAFLFGWNSIHEGWVSVDSPPKSC